MVQHHLERSELAVDEQESGATSIASRLFGRDDDYGHSVMTPTAGNAVALGGGDPYGTSAMAAYPPAIVPNAICVVYMKFENVSFHAWHAFFLASTAGTSFEDHQKFAEARLSDMRRGKWDRIEPAREGMNFHNFNFGSRQRIFMFIDGAPNVKFDEFNGARFTKYSAYPGTNGRPKLMRKNSSFVRGRFIGGIATLKNERLFYLENQFKKFKIEDDEFSGHEDIVNLPGQSTHSGPLQYSMNIHLLMKTADGTSEIPIIIDPTTGNGGGAQP